MPASVGLQELREVREPALLRPLDEAVWQAWVAKGRVQDRRGSAARATAAEWVSIAGLLAAAGSVVPGNTVCGRGGIHCGCERNPHDEHRRKDAVPRMRRLGHHRVVKQRERSDLQATGSALWWWQAPYRSSHRSLGGVRRESNA